MSYGRNLCRGCGENEAGPNGYCEQCNEMDRDTSRDAYLLAQTVGTVVNHLSRPVKRREPGTPWADCKSCHNTFSPASDQCPACGSEAIKFEGEN